MASSEDRWSALPYFFLGCPAFSSSPSFPSPIVESSLFQGAGSSSSSSALTAEREETIRRAKALEERGPSYRRRIRRGRVGCVPKKEGRKCQSTVLWGWLECRKRQERHYGCNKFTFYFYSRYYHIFRFLTSKSRNSWVSPARFSTFFLTGCAHLT